MATSAHAIRVSQFEEQARLVAELDVEGIWQGMKAAAIRGWEQLDRQGLFGEELEKALRSQLEGLSDKPIEALARAGAGTSYNEGRNVSIQEGKELGQVQYAIRSEVMDPRTCDSCAALDGKVVEIGTDEYDEYEPPAFCEGGENCRGFYVALDAGPGGEADLEFDPEQARMEFDEADHPRDSDGKFTDGGEESGGSGSSKEAVTPGTLTADIPATPGFLYHATNEDNLRDIADSMALEPHDPSYGTDQDAWPDGGEEARTYFTASPKTATSFAPEEGRSVLIRIAREGGRVSGLNPRFKDEKGTSDVYSRGIILTKDLQYYGSDKDWHSVADLKGKWEGDRRVLEYDEGEHPRDDSGGSAKMEFDFNGAALEFDPDQERDETGRWTSGGGGTAAMRMPAGVKEGQAVKTVVPTTKGRESFLNRANYKNVGDKWKDETRAAFASALAHTTIPDEHLSGIKTINIIGTGHLSSDGGVPSPGDRGSLGKDGWIVGMCWLGQGKISLATGRNTGDITQTLAHEVAHASLDRFTRSERWKEISEDGKNCKVSAYGRTNAKEHFAEAYSKYVTKGYESLHRIDPKAAEFIHYHIFNRPIVGGGKKNI